MQLTVNGKILELAGELSIAELLATRGLGDGAAVAVEHNSRWLSRDEWPRVSLRDGDRLEVVRLVTGG
jgi:thiamine biosynthesis protein ThiS